MIYLCLLEGRYWYPATRWHVLSLSWYTWPSIARYWSIEVLNYPFSWLPQLNSTCLVPNCIYNQPFRPPIWDMFDGCWNTLCAHIHAYSILYTYHYIPTYIDYIHIHTLHKSYVKSPLFTWKDVNAKLFYRGTARGGKVQGAVAGAIGFDTNDLKYKSVLSIWWRVFPKQMVDHQLELNSWYSWRAN